MSELRVALRSLLKNAGASLVMVATLAVAIGAATVIFSTIDMIWRVVPIADRTRFVYLASSDTRQVGASASTVLRDRVSIPDLADWSAATSFEAFTALAFSTATMSGIDVPVGVSTARVTTNLLPLWGIAPEIGRLFRPEEAGASDQGGVALLTHRFWERQFSASPAVLGRSVRLNGQSHSIIGVLPATVSAGLLRDTDVVVPLALDPARAARDDRSLFVVARLKPGIGRTQAAAELSAIATRLQREHPSTNARIGAIVDPLIEASGMSVRLLLSFLVLITALLLAMACANIANILLAQNTARQHESAVRSALGGSRFDRLRQLGLEHLILSLAAGVAGTAMAVAGIGLIRSLAGGAFGFAEMTVNPRVLLVTAATSLVAPLAFGLLPAWRSAAVSADSLREGSRSVGTRRILRSQGLLIAVQVGLAVILTIQVTLLSLSAWRLGAVDAGFEPDGLLTFRLELPERWTSEPSRAPRFVESVLNALSTLPGVDTAGAIDRLPILESQATGPLFIEGATDLSPEGRPVAARAAITARYLQSMRIPVLRGRSFTDSEVSLGSRVAIVNAELVRRHFQGRDPIGARVALGPVSTSDDWLQIVGVVGNVRNSDVDQGAMPEVYVPSSPLPGRSVAFALRSTGPAPSSFAPSIRFLVATLDPDQAPLDVAPMRQVMADDVAGTTVLTMILIGVGLVALSLAASGIYAVTSFAVSQRTREIGLRIALGAVPSRAVSLILGQTAVPVLWGGMVGLSAALVLAAQFAISTTDPTFREPLPYAAIIILLLTTAVVASYIPARRAARVNPMTALRTE